MANEGDWPPSELMPNYEPKYKPNHCIHHLLSIIFRSDIRLRGSVRISQAILLLANILMYFERV